MFVFTEVSATGGAPASGRADHRGERLDLDRIAEHGAGAVRLDVADLLGQHLRRCAARGG